MNPEPLRFQKIYTASELEDAHVVQALLRRNGVTAWLIHSNGVVLNEDSPISENDYKLFVPATQFEHVQTVFREALNYTEGFPVAGSLDAALAGSQAMPHGGLNYDPVGPEEFLWNPPVAGDLIGNAWETASTASRTATPPRKKTEESELPTCDKCGHEMPAGMSICPTCGEIR